MNEEKEPWWRRAKRAAKETGKKIVNWCQKHPAIVFMAVETVIVVGAAVRSSNNDPADDLRIYDPESDTCWEIKRPLSQDENEELQRLTGEGVGVGYALKIMNLLA